MPDLDLEKEIKRQLREYKKAKKEYEKRYEGRFSALGRDEGKEDRVHRKSTRASRSYEESFYGQGRPKRQHASKKTVDRKLTDGYNIEWKLRNNKRKLREA